MICILLPMLVASCRRTGNTVDNPKVSNSQYNFGYLSFAKHRDIIRYNNKDDSFANDISASAAFGDSSSLNYFPDTAGHVFFNNTDIGSPSNYVPSSGWHYNYIMILNDAAMNSLVNPAFKVLSPNGVTDMTFNVGTMSLYNNAVPRTISRTAGLTIPLNSTVVPDADSVRVSMEGWSNLDTMVSANIGSFTISPAYFSALVPDSTYYGYTLLMQIIKTHNLTINGKKYIITCSRTMRWYYNVD